MNKNKSIEIFNELIDELVMLKDLQNSVDSRLINRLTVRSFFSLLDAFSYSLKLISLKIHKYEKNIFSPKELCFLREGKYITDNDIKVWKPCLPGVKESIKLSLKLFAKSHKTETPLVKYAPLPPEFKMALELRTRVTHPKSLDGLFLATNEMNSIWIVLEWLIRLIIWTRDLKIIAVRNASININKISKKSVSTIKDIKKQIDETTKKNIDNHQGDKL